MLKRVWRASSSTKYWRSSRTSMRLKNVIGAPPLRVE